jgi:hypothetical protein
MPFLFITDYLWVVASAVVTAENREVNGSDMQIEKRYFCNKFLK